MLCFRNHALHRALLTHATTTICEGGSGIMMAMGQRRSAQTFLGSSRLHFLQLMQQDCGVDLAVLQSTKEYAVVSAGAVWTAGKAEEGRLLGKAGLNVGTRTVSNVTRGFHDATVGKVAETEVYKKLDEKVITPVLRADAQQVFFFRGSMPADARAAQKERRRRFVEKHRQQLSANTAETSLVVAKQKSKISTWYKAALDSMKVVQRRQCLERVSTQYPEFTDVKLLYDYQHYLVPAFVRAVWDEDLPALQKMCTASCFKLRIQPYLVQLKGYKRDCSLLQVETAMLVQAELLSPDELMVEEAADEEDAGGGGGDDSDDFDEELKRKKKAEKAAKKAAAKKKTQQDDEKDKEKEKEKGGEDAKENLFEEEDFVSAEIRKLPTLTVAVSTQVYECYRDANGKVVHGSAEVASTMGHLWRLCMLPSGEWVIADCTFGSRYGMESS